MIFKSLAHLQQKRIVSLATAPELKSLESGLRDGFLGFAREKFFICEKQNIAGLTSQSAADFLERLEIDAHCLTLFQPPQRCMTDTRLLRQPIEGALFIGQQFVERGYNHDREGHIYHIWNILSTRNISWT